MNTTSSPTKNGFPFAEYLNQLLFNPNNQTILNPFKFWHIYRIEQLEHCWKQDWTELLEHCWILKYEPQEYLVRMKMPWGMPDEIISEERDGNIPI